MDLYGFSFKKIGSGIYRVTYTTPKRGDYYICNISDMTLIDSTLHADNPKVKDIKHLKHYVISTGAHYNSYGDLIPNQV